MKNFRFLAIAILMLSIFILPVNASTIYDNIPVHVINIYTGNYNIIVHNADSVYLIGAWTASLPNQPPNRLATYQGTSINGYDISSEFVSVYSDHPANTNSLPLIDVLNAGITPYVIHNPNHYSSVYYTAVIGKGQSGSQSVAGSITFTYDDNYSAKTNTAYIQTSIDHYTDNTVTYNVKCKSEYPDIIFYSSIGNYRDFSLGLINYDETETETQITTGINGTNIYAWSMDVNNGNSRLLQTYLQGRSEIDIPIEPTVEPTGAPDDDLNQYGEKKIFQLRNIDYSSSDMSLIDGINLTVYYIDSNDNFVNKPVYQNNNAPSVIDLNVPIAGGLFVEYGITPNYEPVKIQDYPHLNNRRGFLITQELSSYYNLYYQYYDSDNPLTDINYGIGLIDGNTHLPVSNAAINIDGSNTQYTSNYGGTVFKNITQGLHTFTINKQGYNTLTFTKNIVVTSSIEIEFFPISVIPTATITPSPVRPITPSPTISPIDKPSNIIESVSFGLAKVFGVKTVENANYIFALLIILFPAAIAGGITHQALGFIAGGAMGFVFALAVGLIPVWVFFAMCLLAVIYIMLIRGGEGF